MHYFLNKIKHGKKNMKRKRINFVIKFYIVKFIITLYYILYISFILLYIGISDIKTCHKNPKFLIDFLSYHVVMTLKQINQSLRLSYIIELDNTIYR